MKQQVYVLIALLIATTSPVTGQTPVQEAKRDAIRKVEPDDPHMLAAFRKARDSLDRFLVLARKPPPGTSSFAVKVGITDKGRTEYFWISDFLQTGDAFIGRIDNRPRMVSNVSEGQRFKFLKSDVVDWLYIDNPGRRMHGNFTACAMLKRESAAEAAKFKKEYGLECDN